MSSAGSLGLAQWLERGAGRAGPSPSTRDRRRRQASEGPGSPGAHCPMHPPLRPSHNPHWEVRSWGEDQTGLLLLSPGSQVSSGGRGRKERKREKEKRGAREAWPPLSGDFQGRRWEAWGGGWGCRRRDPTQQRQRRRRRGEEEEQAGGRPGCAALVEEGPRGHGDSGGGEEGWGGAGRGKAEQQGRQRRHTRLYPVEISRALKSSESMLPVCFCSRTQGQQRRPGPE